MTANNSVSIATLSTLIVMAANTTYAQEYSFGASIEVGNGEVDVDGAGVFDTEFTLLKLNGAATYPLGVGYYGGGDLSLGFAITDDDFTPDFISGNPLEQLHRLRVIGGYTTGQFDVYAAAGFAYASGDFFAGSPWEANSFDGLTLGIGANYAINDMWTVGAEVIRDDLESDGSKTTTWESTSLDVRAAYRF